MKKLTIALLFIASTAFAQEESADFNTKIKASLQIGAANPLGALASKDYGSDEAGYASGGLSIGLQFEYLVHENISITANYTSMAFALNGDEFKKDIDANVDDPTFITTVSDDPYGYGFFAVGIKTTFGNDVIKGYFNPIIGYSSIVAPEQEVRLSDGSTTIDIIAEELDDSNIMYGINIGSDIRVSELISIGLNFGYFISGDFELKGNTDVKQTGFETQKVSGEYQFAFSAVNSTVSLGFNF